jgi:transposase InsO family protein
MIEDIRQFTGHGVRPICAALEVPRSSYYHAAEPTPTQRSDEQLGDMIQAIFNRHRRRYGYRRIWEELADQDIVCAADRVRRIMRERGLRAIQPKTYVPRTSDGRADKPSPNLLLDKPLPEKPDQVWAGDITFIPTSNGWLYLAVIIDLYSRKIVGWSLDDNLRTPLVIDALKQALGSRSTTQKPIFHSDRGSQYGSGTYREILRQAGMRQSMSARANPYHNAWTESFMGTLKAEMLQDGCFINAEDARTEIFAYIDSYYNTQRKHSALGYQTPAQFEAEILTSN